MGKTSIGKLIQGLRLLVWTLMLSEKHLENQKRGSKKISKQTFLQKRRCTHTVQIADESSKNILGIDFLQKFRLHLDPKTKEITFQSAPSKALFATKNFTLPPFATTLVQVRTFQAIDNKLHYIADIGAPKQPLISGLPKSVHSANTELCSAWSQYSNPGHPGHIKYRRGRSNSIQRWKPRYHLWTKLPTATKSQEESMDQERNRKKMPPWSSRTLSQPVYRHLGQTPSGHQPGQIRPGTGQELHKPNSPQK